VPPGSIPLRRWHANDMNQPAAQSTVPHDLRRYVFLAAVSLLLASCTLTHTRYTRQSLDTPAQWQYIEHSAGTAERPPPRHQWWLRFQDPDLNALIDQALQRNADLAAAALRVHRAQLQSQLARNQQLPDVTASVTFEGTRTLHKPTYTTRTAGTSLAASYEIDLWGRLSSLSDAAQWEAKATEQDRESTALTLIGTLMRLYWQSAHLSQLVRSSEASIDYAQRTLALIEAQYRAGAVTELEVVQAHQNLETQRASHAQLLDQQTQAAHALALLFDAPPERMQPVALQSLTGVVLPAVDPGVPAEVLSYRPDVHAAELRLRETLSNVDATRAGFYPTFTLTGSLGTASTRLAEVLQNPVATLGAGVVLPFIQWRDAKYTIEISRTEYQEAAISFRSTFYRALSDVENALSARGRLAEQNESLNGALQDAGRAERLSEVRYRAGAVALTSWLDAQQTRRIAEEAWALNRFNQLAAQVALYEALGGA